MKKTILYLFIISTICIKSYAQDSSWVWVAPNNYVNIETVNKDNEISGYSFMLKSYNKGQYEPVNGHEIFYTIARYKLNCQDYSYKIGIIDSYGKNDNFVNGDYNKFAKFQPVISDTAISSVAKNLCKIP